MLAGLVARAVALLAADQHRARARAPRSGAGGDGRLRLSHRRRGQPLARAAGGRCASAPTSSATSRPTSPSTCAATSPAATARRSCGKAASRSRRRWCPGSTSPAQENVDFSLRKLDKRQGWRGPVAHLTGAAAEEFRRRVAAHYGAEPPAEGQLYLGLVEAAIEDGAPRARRQGHLPAAVGQHDLGLPLQRQERRQRHASSTRRSACCAPATSSG